MVVAHRWIAQPAGRKVDPTDWPDADLNAWIASPYSGPKVYQVLGLPVYQRQDLAGAVAGHLDSGAHVTIDATAATARASAIRPGFVDLMGWVSRDRSARWELDRGPRLRRSGSRSAIGNRDGAGCRSRC